MGKFIREKWGGLIRKTENSHKPREEAQISLSSFYNGHHEQKLFTPVKD